MPQGQDLNKKSRSVVYIPGWSQHRLSSSIERRNANLRSPLFGCHVCKNPLPLRHTPFNAVSGLVNAPRLMLALSRVIGICGRPPPHSLSDLRFRDVRRIRFLGGCVNHWRFSLVTVRFSWVYEAAVPKESGRGAGEGGRCPWVRAWGNTDDREGRNVSVTSCGLILIAAAFQAS